MAIRLLMKIQKIQLLYRRTVQRQLQMKQKILGLTEKYNVSIKYIYIYKYPDRKWKIIDDLRLI